MKPLSMPWFAALLLAALAPGLFAAPASRPNIVVIMADDMGYSDLGCYGSEIHTPNLDALAMNGLRFTQFYNTARCCPTRAALLTGVYSHQAGVGHMVGDDHLPGYRGTLAPNVLTFAEALRPAGYGTYMTGKWHVCPANEQARSNWPMQRGFDRFYGTLSGGGDYFDPAVLARDNRQISPFADPQYKPAEPYYYTDALSDQAARFIREHDASRKADPLALYVAFTSPHWPLHAREADIAKYKGKYDAGFEAVREARLRRMREMGFLGAGWTPAPLPQSWVDVNLKEWQARCMEVFAAQIDRMDQGVGRIVAALRDTGRLDNTLILFFQDNGGCAENMGRVAPKNPQERGKPRPLDEPSPNTRAQQLRDGTPVRQGPGVMPGPEDTYLAYGEGWAAVSNTPFREYKHWVHEGGISTALVAHWPAGITRKGELERQPGHLIDIMATLLDVTGAPYPAERDGAATVPLEGTTLRPAFAGRPIGRDEPIFFEHEGNRAVRDGDWKLVAKGPSGAWELYDMRGDRTEQHDLARQQPDRVKELAAKWDAWAKRANVLPWPWEKERSGGAVKGPDGALALKGGDTLNADASPAVGKQAIRITASIAKPGRNGVIVAQGGTAEGYTLYLKDGRPAFAVRRGGTLTLAESPDALPPDAAELTAALDAAGRMTLTSAGRMIATGNAGGTLNRKPGDGLSVGSDTGAAVGPYDAPFAFDGTVGEVKIAIGGKP